MSDLPDNALISFIHPSIPTEDWFTHREQLIKQQKKEKQVQCLDV